MTTANTTKTRKRPTATKAAKAPANAPARTEEAPPASNGDKAETPTSGLDLAVAYWKAIDARDETTGTIPAVALDGVKVAFREADPRKRANQVKALKLEASDRIVSDEGEIDTGLALAVKVLSALLAEVRVEVIASEKPAHDPVPHVAAILAAVDRFRAELVGQLSDDQRGQLDKVQVPDDDATAAVTAVGKALERIRERAFNSRSGYSGPRKPAAETAAAIRKAVHEASGPLTESELAKATGLDTSTVYSRWKGNNTEGVRATTDDQGRKVFVKAS